MLRKLILCLISLLVSAAAMADHAGLNNKAALGNINQLKIVVDLNVGGDLLLKRLGLLTATFDQLVTAGVKPKVVVAIRGQASRYVTESNSAVQSADVPLKNQITQSIISLAGRGVTFEQCAIAASSFNIDLEDFPARITVVQNGYISLIGYQEQGYRFLPMD